MRGYQRKSYSLHFRLQLIWCHVALCLLAGAIFFYCFGSRKDVSFLAVATPGSSSLQVHSSQTKNGFSANEVRLAVPKGADPYNLFETEIVAAALQPSGIVVSSVLEVPNLRTLDTVSLGLADVGTTVFYADEKNLNEKGLSFTGPVLPCPVYAISLQSIPKFEALRNLRIEAHQGADVAYGVRWKDLARPKVLDGSWRNVSDQNAQVRMLFAGRTDLILIGPPIFYYMWHLNQLDPLVKGKGFVINTSLQPQPMLWSGYVARNPELVTKIREGFHAIRENGAFEKISKRYNLEGHVDAGMDFKAIQLWRNTRYEALVHKSQPGTETASSLGTP